MKLTRKIKTATLVFFILLSISLGRCQDEDEDDEEYEEDTVDDTTTKRYRIRSSTTTTEEPPPETTVKPETVASGRNDTTGDGNSTQKATSSANSTSSTAGSQGGGATSAAAGGAAASSAAVATAVTVAPTTPAPTVPPTYPTPGTRGTTPADSEEEPDPTTEEGLGYVFRPLNNIIDNIVAGNVSGIVDHALSIRAPPEVREFVNHVMHNVFGVGIGSALKQFVPSLFSASTQAPVETGRDPIPTETPPATPAPIAIPIQAIIDARSNASEEGKSSKTSPQLPLQLKVSHPGAPASRLRCEVVAD